MKFRRKWKTRYYLMECNTSTGLYTNEIGWSTSKGAVIETMRSSRAIQIAFYERQQWVIVNRYKIISR